MTIKNVYLTLVKTCLLKQLTYLNLNIYYFVKEVVSFSCFKKLLQTLHVLKLFSVILLSIIH